MKKLLKFNNPEYLLLLSFGLCYYIFVLYDNHISLSFNYQYFLYDYHFGFIKRGLIGNLLNCFSLQITQQAFMSIATVLIVFLGIFIVKIIDYIKFNNKFYGYFLVSFLVISPALLKNLWFDLGRLDIFGILYCLLLIFPFNKKVNTIIFLLSPLILFVHEGFFLLWLPSYFICWIIKNDINFNKNVIIYSMIFIISSFLLLFLISKYGKISVDFTVFETYLQSKTNDKVSVDNTVITENLYKQIYSSFKANFTHIKFWFLGFINLFSIIYVINLFFRTLKIKLSKYRIIYIPLLFSFVLFFLGSDALRWFSNMCFSMYLILICVLIKENKSNDNEEEFFDVKELIFLIFFYW